MLEKLWAIVELFGHQQIAGEVSDQEIAGNKFVRVDVPKVEGAEPFTKFYGSSAIYSITPVTEEIALRAVRGLMIKPINVYMLASPDPAKLQSGDDSVDYEDAYDDDDDDVEPRRQSRHRF